MDAGSDQGWDGLVASIRMRTGSDQGQACLVVGYVGTRMGAGSDQGWGSLVVGSRMGSGSDQGMTGYVAGTLRIVGMGDTDFYDYPLRRRRKLVGPVWAQTGPNTVIMYAKQRTSWASVGP